MVLTALRGAVGFLTRLPVGSDERAWEAFRDRPYVLPLAGYCVGLVVGLPLLAAALPAPTVGLLYLLAVVLVTGINHLDGLADIGDAMVVHGGPDERRTAMKDTAVGVGAVVAVGIGLLGLVLGGFLLATLPARQAFGVGVAAEVGAKLSMVTLAGLGEATHEGLGSQLTGASPGQMAVAVLLGVPATFLAWPTLAALPAVIAGPLVGAGLLWWARRNLGGVSGDVFGASNELARVAGVNAGVVAWTLL